MITKGMKVGDYFEDGGLYYVVDEVLDSGDYVSHNVEKPLTQPQNEPQAIPEKPKRTVRKKA